MISLTEFLIQNGHREIEGFSQQLPKQVADLTRLARSPSVLRIMEIGFNAGHSAEVFLRAKPDTTVVSFDLGFHDYVSDAKQYIDAVYSPQRHRLILGDSRHTVPNYPNETFDLIFIDGGHEEDVARADLENCRRFAHSHTILIVDDTIYTPEWVATYTIGPTQVWTEGVAAGRVIEKGRSEYAPGRGMSWGQYGG